MTIASKAALGSGASFWKTKTADGLPAAVLSDGPHGVRAQDASEDHLGIAPSQPATCFPPAAGLAQSWDRGIVERVGAAIALEAQHYGIGVQLGPGINIRRDPRGGRNFEYYSEDPLLSGELGAAWVTAVQAGGVGASVKHFAANNAETDRMRSDSQVDERTLREILLPAFERVVRHAKPWTVMAAYNRINGEYACQNHWLLTEVLRDDWGFDGAVISDWGAVDDRVASVAAGLDLEMPGGSSGSDAEVVAAVDRGELQVEVLDRAAGRVLTLLERVRDGTRPDAEVDFDAHHIVAREAAERSIVLLKNEEEILPINAGMSIAVIGKFAKEPRIQGAGSSHVNASRVDIPLEEIRTAFGSSSVSYSAGFGDVAAADLLDQATAAARSADVAVVFLGLESHHESEGFDRTDIDLPAQQLELLRAVATVQPRTVVILSHGGVVRLTEVNDLAMAVLDGALLGQAGGGAIAGVLSGRVNPSGRLAETVPVRLQDAPSYLSFPGEGSVVRYSEGIFVGYRWYDARQLPVTYPFGHGLSYTSFEYGVPEVRVVDGDVTVRLSIQNVGQRNGREVVQLYVGKPESRVARAVRELKGFVTVDLDSGDSSEIEITIPRADLAYWDEQLARWVVEDGEYTLSIGASSRDIRHTASTTVVGDIVSGRLTERSTLAEVMAHPVAGPLLATMTPQRAEETTNDESMGIDVGAMMAQIPLNRLVSFSGGELTAERLSGLLALANGDGLS
nr:glycoside hydrolase family 3 C-terminal domain-containing protein [uncultured Microbacterium sp.]